MDGMVGIRVAGGYRCDVYATKIHILSEQAEKITKILHRYLGSIPPLSPISLYLGKILSLSPIDK